MKANWLIICVFLVVCLSCKSSKSKFTETQINALETLITSRNYTIKSDWAKPQVTNAMQQVLNSGVLQPGNTAGAISLIGNDNYLTVSNDSVTSYLPYYGERQMGTIYGDNGGIELNGILENYQVSKGKHQSYLVKFNASSKTERFNVIIQLFPNLKSEMSILSSSRFPISYTGIIKSSNE
ncbi:DUF4251 domain-containing protein [uncultured Algibacter sp.]|uniref:DUF4251 domain-containing protein n=1 Tax=uncultured Algibacter sp. TaxID=298659 RepID=UPI002610F2A8|nr:DUF4251 domain-containing protein [uncultured Algibacter sp.]